MVQNPFIIRRGRVAEEDRTWRLDRRLPMAKIGAMLPMVVEPTMRVILPFVSGGRAVSERQSQSDFDAPGDGGRW